MKRPKQSTFEGLNAPNQVFGGALLTSHPKTKRPLDSKLPTHLVLRAQRSAMRNPKYYLKVNQIVRTVCAKHGVRLYEYANVGNHLHLLLKLRTRRSWAAFIRELTGRIAQLTKVKWVHRPFTRIVSGWKKAYRIVREYVELNRRDADGLISKLELIFLRELQLGLSKISFPHGLAKLI